MNPSERVLKVALIGVDQHSRGFGARAHIPALLAAPNIQLEAVCTTRVDSARLAAERFGAKRYYTNVEDLVQDENIDLINVAVRVRSHYSLVWTALKAKKMVYCEWPLGLNVLEAKTLVGLAKQNNLLTALGTQGRFAPGILYMKHLIKNGYIGRPLLFHLTHFLPRFPVLSDHWWSAMEEEHSGALGVACAHATDTLQSVLGAITEISGYAETLHPQDHYADTQEPFMWTAMDAVSYQARLASGVTGTAHISNLSTQQMGFRLDVFGENGQLTATAPYYVSYSPITLKGMRAGEPEAELEIPANYFLVKDLEVGSAGYNIAQALVKFRQAWLTGEEFHANFQDGYNMHGLLAAIKTSWHERRWVKISPDGV
jgi:predicted dehydrogenase